MDFVIRKMELKDKEEVLLMMEEFYLSDAVYTNGSKEIFETDFNNCINENPYLEGYIFNSKTQILGYAMLAKSFSTEFGKPCLWFEDLYLKPKFRGYKIIPSFMDYVIQTYPDYIYRLEVEKENTHAVYVYENKGFKTLPYIGMFK